MIFLCGLRNGWKIFVNITTSGGGAWFIFLIRSKARPIMWILQIKIVDLINLVSGPTIITGAGQHTTQYTQLIGLIYISPHHDWYRVSQKQWPMNNECQNYSQLRSWWDEYLVVGGIKATESDLVWCTHTSTNQYQSIHQANNHSSSWMINIEVNNLINHLSLLQLIQTTPISRLWKIRC